MRPARVRFAALPFAAPLLTLAAPLLALSLLAAAAMPAAAADRVVHVYNWSDYIDPQSLKDFTKDTGIKVVYDTYDSNETLETKLLAGKSGYDVVVPSAANLARMIKAGVFQKLDTAKLANIGHMWPDIMSRLATYDPGNQYAINYMWGTTGIGYNVDKIKKIMPDAPVDFLDLIFKPEILAKFKSCGVQMLDSPDDILSAALHYLNIDPDSKKPEDLQKAADLMAAIRPSIQKFHSSQYIDALANGDICLAVGYSGDVIQARDRGAKAKRKVNVAYSLPKEGAMMWFDSFAIPASAPHPAEALAFIDYMMKPEIAARNSNFVEYANGNKDSQPLLDKDVFTNPDVYPTADAMKKLYTTTPNDPATQRVVTRVWTKVKTGK